MKSYKNWKLINESFISGMTLGLSHPQSLGLHSNLGGFPGIEEKKKMSGEVLSDDDGCSCKHKKKKKHDDGEEELKFAKKKMKKNMKDYPSKEDDDRYVDRSPAGRKRARTHADTEEKFNKAQESPDYDDTEYAAKQSASAPGYKVRQNMKKKMKKHMSADVDVDDVEDFDHEGDDDVNDVDVPDDHGDDDDDVEGDDHEEPDGDEDGPDMDDDGDGDDDGEGDDEGGEEDLGGDDEGDDDGGDDAVKFGFMKDKKKEWEKRDKAWKKSMKKRKDENSFWEDIDKNYRVPQNEVGTDEEFFDSLNRQYGNPYVRFSGGVDRVDEDLLLSPDQQALIDAMPKPGEVGYAPNQRLGGDFGGYETPVLGHLPYGESAEYEDDYDDEDAQDFEVLSKYFSESVAHDLIQKRKSR